MRYSGHIVDVPVTLSEMFISCTVLTNIIVQTHGRRNNHHLLLQWVRRHLEKNSPLHFPHAKSTFYHIADARMQMVKKLLLTTRCQSPSPIRNMIPLSLVRRQVTGAVWVSCINSIVFFCNSIKLLVPCQIFLALLKNNLTIIPIGG